GQGLKVTGVPGGYQGLVESRFQELDLRALANIIQRGGTILKTGRSQDFMRPEGRARAAKALQSQSIQALVVIGGDGSFQGAQLLFQEHQIPVVGIPGTIDNDVPGTDRCIGFDTAINTALDAIDRIRDTAASHDRLFIVEVMGRDSGFIAAAVGLAGGAEEIFTPEHPIHLEKLIERIQAGIRRGKSSSILVTAEGQKPGRAYDLAEQLRKRAGFDAKVCILGHQQRGGAPTAMDRVLASRMGAEAIQCLLEGKTHLMIGAEGEKIRRIPFDQIFGKRRLVSAEDVQLSRALAI
ncbi:MAG: ATP-dependent 6-phosphofructokinase, partial [Bdellovibrio sp.]